jgi:hypothetical protein
LQSQFSPRDATSAYDCAATAGAMAGDADSRGQYVFTHSQVRAGTNEPRPKAGSPGLTIHQVADSLQRLTHGEVVLDVYAIGSPWDAVPDALQQGKWAVLAIWRKVLVDAGWGGSSPFPGGHGVIYGYDQNIQEWLLGDPLTPRWLYVPPSVVKRACRELLIRIGAGAGYNGAYYGFTRDVYTEDETAPPEGVDRMFNIGPVNTHRDALVKKGAILYADSALTDRHSVVDDKKDTPFGFNGSGSAFHVIVNAGNTNYVKRSDVIRIYPHEREFS